MLLCIFTLAFQFHSPWYTTEILWVASVHPSKSLCKANNISWAFTVLQAQTHRLKLHHLCKLFQSVKELSSLMIPLHLACRRREMLIYSIILFYFYKFIYFLFIYFWLRWVFVAAHGLSLVAASGDYSSLRCAGFSLQWLLWLRSTGSRCAGFSSCGSAGSRAQAQ